MNPIPLTSPDGVTFAYACGVCRQVPSVGHKFVPLTDEDVAMYAESARRQAASCCACERCGACVPKGSEDDWLHRVCATCLPTAQAEQEAREVEWEKEAQRKTAIREESLTKAADVDAAWRLNALMRDISENCYAAGWLMGLEFTLWEMVQGSERAFGVGLVTEDEVAELRHLAETSGGWWMWLDYAGGEVFVPIADWLQTFETGGVQ